MKLKMYLCKQISYPYSPMIKVNRLKGSSTASQLGGLGSQAGGGSQYSSATNLRMTHDLKQTRKRIAELEDELKIQIIEFKAQEKKKDRQIIELQSQISVLQNRIASVQRETALAKYSVMVDPDLEVKHLTEVAVLKQEIEDLSEKQKKIERHNKKLQTSLKEVQTELDQERLNAATIEDRSRCYFFLSDKTSDSMIGMVELLKKMALQIEHPGQDVSSHFAKWNKPFMAAIDSALDDGYVQLANIKVVQEALVLADSVQGLDDAKKKLIDLLDILFKARVWEQDGSYQSLLDHSIADAPVDRGITEIESPVHSQKTVGDLGSQVTPVRLFSPTRAKQGGLSGQEYLRQALESLIAHFSKDAETTLQFPDETGRLRDINAKAVAAQLEYLRTTIQENPSRIELASGNYTTPVRTGRPHDRISDVVADVLVTMQKMLKKPLDGQSLAQLPSEPLDPTMFSPGSERAVTELNRFKAMVAELFESQGLDPAEDSISEVIGYLEPLNKQLLETIDQLNEAKRELAERNYERRSYDYEIARFRDKETVLIERFFKEQGAEANRVKKAFYTAIKAEEALHAYDNYFNLFSDNLAGAVERSAIPRSWEPVNSAHLLQLSQCLGVGSKLTEVHMNAQEFVRSAFYGEPVPVSSRDRLSKEFILTTLQKLLDLDKSEFSMQELFKAFTVPTVRSANRESLDSVDSFNSTDVVPVRTPVRSQQSAMRQNTQRPTSVDRSVHALSSAKPHSNPDNKKSGTGAGKK